MEKSLAGEIVLSNEAWATCAACDGRGWHYRNIELAVGMAVSVLPDGTTAAIDTCIYCTGSGVLIRPEFLEACKLSGARFPIVPSSRMPPSIGVVLHNPANGMVAVIRDQNIGVMHMKVAECHLKKQQK